MKCRSQGVVATSVCLAFLPITTAMAHKVAVHALLTERAAAASLGLQSFLTSVSFDESSLVSADLVLLEAKYRLPVGFACGVGHLLGSSLADENRGVEYLRSPIALLVFGSVMEDFGTRPANHFYMPLSQTTGAALTVSNIELGSDARTWAFLQNTDNRWNWMRAYDEYKRAFSAPMNSERHSAFADMFLTIGHVVHLVQDMSQPSHTRNDPHPGHGLNNACGGPAMFEEWQPDHFACIRTMLEAGTPIVPRFDSSYEYLTRLACYSSTQFFSDDTTQLDPGYSEPSGCPYPPPWRVESEGPGEVGAGCGVCAFGGNRLWNDASQLEASTRVARLRFSSLPFGSTPNDARHFGATIGDQCVLEDNAAELLPKAAAYSTGLIDFFFRAKLELMIDGAGTGSGDAQTIKFRLRNVSVVPVELGPDVVTLKAGGKFEFYAESAEGMYSGAPVKPASISLSKNLPPGGEQSFDLTLPAGFATKRIVAVFDGDIGSERGVVAASADMFLGDVTANAHINADWCGDDEAALCARDLYFFENMWTKHETTKTTPIEFDPPALPEGPHSLPPLTIPSCGYADAAPRVAVTTERSASQVITVTPNDGNFGTELILSRQEKATAPPDLECTHIYPRATASLLSTLDVRYTVNLALGQRLRVCGSWQIAPHADGLPTRSGMRVIVYVPREVSSGLPLGGLGQAVHDLCFTNDPSGVESHVFALFPGTFGYEDLRCQAPIESSERRCVTLGFDTFASVVDPPPDFAVRLPEATDPCSYFDLYADGICNLYCFQPDPDCVGEVLPVFILVGCGAQLELGGSDDQKAGSVAYQWSIEVASDDNEAPQSTP